MDVGKSKITENGHKITNIQVMTLVALIILLWYLIVINQFHFISPTPTAYSKIAWIKSVSAPGVEGVVCWARATRLHPNIFTGQHSWAFAYLKPPLSFHRHLTMMQELDVISATSGNCSKHCWSKDVPLTLFPLSVGKIPARGSIMMPREQANVTALISRPHGYNRKCHEVTLQHDPQLHSHMDSKSNLHFVTSELYLEKKRRLKKKRKGGRASTPGGLWNWWARVGQSRGDSAGMLV